jgi:hypothetical protein
MRRQIVLTWRLFLALAPLPAPLAPERSAAHPCRFFMIFMMVIRWSVRGPQCIVSIKRLIDPAARDV